MERLSSDFALYGSRVKLARTDTVFFPISEVCAVCIYFYLLYNGFRMDEVYFYPQNKAKKQIGLCVP